jgi:RHS repeat-associated protein
MLLSDGTKSYVYGPNGQPIEQITGSTATYLQGDQQNSTRLLTDQSGTVTGTYTFDAYGRTTGHTGAATTPLGYAGQYTDGTGLIYLRARYYDPATAQFLSADPLVDQTWAPYAYAGDNPLSNVDPTGDDFWSSLATSLAITGAGIGIIACVVAEPCGAGLALAGGGTLAASTTIVGAGALGGVGGYLLGGVLHMASDASQSGGNSGGSGGGDAGDSHMIGENGTQTASKTVWEEEPYRIDIENPNPGGRPGQMHFQDQSGQISKCQYNFDTGQFEGLPNSVAKKLANDPAFQRDILKGLKYLGE